LKAYKETGKMDMTQAYPYLIEGIGQDLIPGNFDFDFIDYVEQVSDKDAAQMCRRLATRGRFIYRLLGRCGDARRVLQMADRFKEGDVVVIVFHDHGSRYVGKVYNDDWMRERGFLEDDEVTAKTILQRKREIKNLVSVTAQCIK
jgi:cystathionine beta-synthase